MWSYSERANTSYPHPPRAGEGFSAPFRRSGSVQVWHAKYLSGGFRRRCILLGYSVRRASVWQQGSLRDSCTLGRSSPPPGSFSLLAGAPQHGGPEAMTTPPRQLPTTSGATRSARSTRTPATRADHDPSPCGRGQAPGEKFLPPGGPPPTPPRSRHRTTGLLRVKPWKAPKSIAWGRARGFSRLTVKTGYPELARPGCPSAPGRHAAFAGE